MISRMCGGAAVACLLLAACGSGATTAAREAAVKRTVQTALADLGRGDGPAFCALATPAAQRQIASVITGDTCASLIDSLAGHLSSEHRAGLLSARVRRVILHGATASVTDADITSLRGTLQGFLDDAGRPTTLALEPSGRWKITG